MGVTIKKFNLMDLFEDPSGYMDFGFLPPSSIADVKCYRVGDNGQSVQRWYKPRGVSMAYMMVVSGGGGGGAGKTGLTETARGGGGGGGCSGSAILLIPAVFLPDVLLVQVGSGGTGGIGSGNGGNTGQNSFIALGGGLTPLSTIPNIILASATNAPGGGSPGATTSNAGGGTASTNFSNSQAGHNQLKGIFNNNAGIAGTTGGLATAGAIGTNLTATWNANFCSPGTGGASVSAASTGFAGGSNTLQNALDLNDGGLVASILPGGAGSSGGASGGQPGIILWKHLLFTGGTGGGSTDNAAGGAGGQGGPGCGGGGGGAGTTGGNGGNGGDGFVIIICW